MNKRVLRRAVIFLVLSIIIELAVFNKNAFLSMGSADNIRLEYQASEEFVIDEMGVLNLAGGQRGGLFLEGMSGKLGYMFFDIDCVNYNGEAVPYNLQIAVADEGNAEMYYLPNVVIYSDEQDTKYINAHSYGEVEKMHIYLSANTNVEFRVREIIYNVSVPMNVSMARVFLVFAEIAILWCIRPGSSLYAKSWSTVEKITLVTAVFVVNLLFWHWLIELNPTITEPAWEHHKQYHKLAVAITQGEVSIPIGIEEEVSKLSNPYDYEMRRQEVANAFSGWDTAFYEGKFYVYFGIVPVLLFYLPYYVLTGAAFQTWWGIFIMGIALLAGAFYLLKQLIKRFFPDTPFLLYTILSVLIANCMNTIMFMMRPDFYSLPIMSAMAFSVWGIGLWISAADFWQGELAGDKKSGLKLKLFMGSLCMALVAGCRPQFLLGSFLAVFIFTGCIKKQYLCDRKKLVSNVLVAALPYIVIATGLMYYNYIRFGSPFDFGANYNLTTNDMTHRGLNLGRIADGIFMYLLQFPNLGMKYPYVFATNFTSSYVGTTIREAMYGGVFFTTPVLLALLALSKVKKRLEEKALFGMTVASVVFAVIIVIADTQLAGILSRYYADFVWLLMIGAVIVVLQMWESLKDSSAKKTLILFIVVCGMWGLCMQFGMGMHAGQIEGNNAAAYYAIKAFLF